MLLLVLYIFDIDLTLWCVLYESHFFITVLDKRGMGVYNCCIECLSFAFHPIPAAQSLYLPMSRSSYDMTDPSFISSEEFIVLLIWED